MPQYPPLPCVSHVAISLFSKNWLPLSSISSFFITLWFPSFFSTFPQFYNFLYFSLSSFSLSHFFTLPHFFSLFLISSVSLCLSLPLYSI
ncbi:hypothetical protein FKM82_023389 [Ascaphus truei]